MAEVIDGKHLAEEIIAKVKDGASNLKEHHALQPGLAVILAGQDPASKVYVKSKNRKAEECGFNAKTIELGYTVSQADLIKQVEELNADDTIHGILVQLPLPKHIDEQIVLQAIKPEKDVDGLTFENVGKLASGKEDGFIPCTPAGIMHMIHGIHGKDLSELDAVVVGRSNIVGKPIARLLMNANATATIAHSRTREIAEVVRSADILVVAVGRTEMVKGSWIKPGATVIDVGINRIDAPKDSDKKTKLIGDVEYDTASIIAGHITPVPGGVGPMTIAMLMANTLKAASRAAGVKMISLD